MDEEEPVPCNIATNEVITTGGEHHEMNISIIGKTLDECYTKFIDIRKELKK